MYTRTTIAILFLCAPACSGALPPGDVAEVDAGSDAPIAVRVDGAAQADDVPPGDDVIVATRPDVFDPPWDVMRADTGRYCSPGYYECNHRCVPETADLCAECDIRCYTAETMCLSPNSMPQCCTAHGGGCSEGVTCLGTCVRVREAPDYYYCCAR